MAYRSTIDAFLDQAKSRGSKVALRHKVDNVWREITWTEYAREVRRFARALIHAGVEYGERICIIGPNRPEWLIAGFGAMAAGVAPAGIYATSTAEQVAYIAHHAEAKIVVVHDEKQLKKFRAQKDKLPLVQKYVLMVGKPAGEDTVMFSDFLAAGEAVPEEKVEERLAAIRSDDAATMIYTSGTTGNPKAVIITHENVRFQSDSSQKALGLSSDEHLISYLPLSHIAEQVLSMHGAAWVGYSLSFCEDLNQLGDYLREARPTVFFAVPRVWEKMQAKMQAAGAAAPALRKKIAAWARGVGLRAGYARQRGEGPPFGYGIAKMLVFSKVRERLGLDRCWLAVSGAAAISRSTLEFFLSLDIPIYEVYGMSENTGPGSLSMPGAHKTGSVGRPVPGTELKIAEDGEILMKGPHVFKGYFKDEAATREALDENGYLHSGDVGEIDNDGFLRITDRKKDLFKTAGGKYIAPSNLESLLKAIPGVSQAVVVGEGKKYAVALITVDPEGCGQPTRSVEDVAKDPEVVRRIEEGVKQVNANLASFESIKKVKVLPVEFGIDSGELTPSLKVKRKVVNQRFAKEIEALYAE
jgi:long-subunit acyl-CoA synthetase (AMP-forming)